MYPAIIPHDADYHFVLQDIAHEWTHHYLYFAPLGRRYFDSAKLTTLNETVANMVGRELGDMLFEEYPLPEPPRDVGRAAAPRAPQRAGDRLHGGDARRCDAQVEALLAGRARSTRRSG